MPHTSPASTVESDGPSNHGPTTGDGDRGSESNADSDAESCSGKKKVSSLLHIILSRLSVPKHFQLEEYCQLEVESECLTQRGTMNLSADLAETQMGT